MSQVATTPAWTSFTSFSACLSPAGVVLGLTVPCLIRTSRQLNEVPSPFGHFAADEPPLGVWRVLGATTNTRFFFGGCGSLTGLQGSWGFEVFSATRLRLSSTSSRAPSSALKKFILIVYYNFNKIIQSISILFYLP